MQKKKKKRKKEAVLVPKAKRCSPTIIMNSIDADINFDINY